MYQLSKIAIQPLPYSNSLIYFLLKNNTHFMRWYSTFNFINSKYIYNNSIQNYKYNISFQYTCMNSNIHNKYNDIINSTLTIKHCNDIYNEIIKQEIKYINSNEWCHSRLDYKINTSYIIKKNGEIVNDIDLIKKISNNTL